MEVVIDFDEILQEFNTYGIEICDNEKVRAKSTLLCKTYNLTSEQIAVEWLGFAASNNYEKLTLDTLDLFEKDLKTKKVQRKSVSTPIPQDSVSTTKANLYENDGSLLNTYGVLLPDALQSSSVVEASPKSRVGRCLASQFIEEPRLISVESSLLQSPASHQSQEYGLRKNIGTVVNSYGNSVEATKWRASSADCPKVTEIPCGSERPLTGPFDFMFDKLRNCAEVLDEGINCLGSQLERMLEIENTGYIGAANNDPIWCIGRICCDSNGRLNAASVILEGDRESNAGNTVKLDLSKLTEYFLFPGQVVAVKGVNSTGDCLIADQIVIGKVLPPLQPSVSIKNDIQIMIACGPFTTRENLLYEPLMDFLRVITENPPHILFLLGPLLDSSHPCLDDDGLSDSYDSIVSQCLETIGNALKKTNTKGYILSSYQDISCVPIYPTPPTFLNCSANDAEFNFLADPSLIEIGGFAIGLTTIDYPLHIGREEIACSPNFGDRLSRLSNHLLLQQSFYPIYPPAEELSYNIEKADLFTRLPCTPHVMITPSNLKGYIKDVNGCLFINPERLSKGKGGGSYCRLEVKASDQERGCDVNAQLIKI